MNSGVKRYDPVHNGQGDCWADCEEKADGDYVLFSAYESLEQQNRDLVEALKFECGNRCAPQNPCNAREVLERYGVEL